MDGNPMKQPNDDASTESISTICSGMKVWKS